MTFNAGPQPFELSELKSLPLQMLDLKDMAFLVHRDLRILALAAHGSTSGIDDFDVGTLDEFATQTSERMSHFRACLTQFDTRLMAALDVDHLGLPNDPEKRAAEVERLAEGYPEPRPPGLEHVLAALRIPPGGGA